MRVNPICISNNRPLVRNRVPAKMERIENPENLSNTAPTFKGIKNALRGGGVGVLAGALVGSIFCPGLGTAGGAALMAAIVGAVGAAGCAGEDDKESIFKGIKDNFKKDGNKI